MWVNNQYRCEINQTVGFLNDSLVVSGLTERFTRVLEGFKPLIVGGIVVSIFLLTAAIWDRAAV